MSRFTLKLPRWYAMDYLHSSGDDLFDHHSPIYVFEVRPQKTGKRIFDLSFWHLNYPEGVRDKVYPLRVLNEPGRT